MKSNEPLFDGAELARTLAALPGWTGADGWLRREYRTDGWRSTMLAVNAIAFVAEAGNHHPDLEVHWGRVVVMLQTHSAGGITEKDLQMAERIEATVALAAEGRLPGSRRPIRRMDHGVTAAPVMRPVIIPLDPPPEPLELLERFAHLPFPVLLDGAADHHDLGRYSYFAADPIATLRGWAADWPALRDRLRGTLRSATPIDAALPPFQGGWIGWLGYELGAAFDRMPRAAQDPLDLPDLSLALYDWVIAWDHATGAAWLVSNGIDADGVPDPARAQHRADAVLAQLANRCEPSARDALADDRDRRLHRRTPTSAPSRQ